MKFLNTFMLVTFFSAQVFAAQFSPVSKLDSSSAQKLAQAGLSIVSNQDVFGDNGAVVAFSFTRKATEADMSTVKQLSYKFGANSDDSQEDFQNASVKNIIDFAFTAIEIQEGENENAFKIARANLTVALNAIKADRTLRIYGNQHADEDGSWNILFVFDSKNNQVVMVKIGYSGT